MSMGNMRWFFPAWNGDHRLLPSPDNKEHTHLVIQKPTSDESKKLNILGAALKEAKWVDEWKEVAPGGFFSRKREVVIKAPLERVGPLFVWAFKPGPAVLTAVKYEDGKVITCSEGLEELVDLSNRIAKDVEDPKPGRLPDECQFEVARDFARSPAGRVEADGPNSGERFRKELVKLLGEYKKIRIGLDGTLGYGSSFLQEAFGGLVTEHNYKPKELHKTIELVSEDGSLVKEIWSYVDDAKPKPKPEAAATVKRHTPCCPDCIPGSIGPASEVLLAFLNEEEHESWAKERCIYVQGGLTEATYRIAHRHSKYAQEQSRICMDLDAGVVVHFHDTTVPPEEEVLAAKLILEHREPWLRNEATMLGYLGFSKYSGRNDSGPVFKNPFGDGMDGVADANFTHQIGRFFSGGSLW